MKLLHSSKKKLLYLSLALAAAACIVVAAIAVLAIKAHAPGRSLSAAPATDARSVEEPAMKKAISTVFWVGEPADGDNGGIANRASAWDEEWTDHFGGIDDPAKRQGYLPAAFQPKENPFYVALPYNDIDTKGSRKQSAPLCPNANVLQSQPYSWCKNAWVKIEYKGKIVYAQWEDVGPFEEDDAAYVFGNTDKPKNRRGMQAGIDVSPAVQTYLGLQDVDIVTWSFVETGKLPEGPWKRILTVSLGGML
jgi:hypothetical protein